MERTGFKASREVHVETVGGGGTAADDDDDDDEVYEDPFVVLPGADSMEQRPLCSVLNTVVNHVMVPPSPMEPEEFQEILQRQLLRRRRGEDQGKNQATSTGVDRKTSASKTNQGGNEAAGPAILVPVLRIFGPIIRGDAPSGKDPVQSACLYIHGAFPYILARPVAAGPDGSLHHSSHLRLSRRQGQQSPMPLLLTGSGHLDWDSPEAVESAAAVIQQNLEDAIQASLVDRREQENDRKGTGGTKKRGAVVTPTTRCIRKVSVVVGRGFYTYCPGPPAPFLKVSYYDPKMRWKVKLMLERGLDLPMMYHPDPQQYDAVARAPAADSSQLGLEPLAFHCYEAHIPHTMQFFKDWNLAGMSYIHLSEGKFRNHLPATVRQRWAKEVAHGTGLDDPAQYAFLTTNTPPECVWGDTTTNQELLHLSTPEAFKSQTKSTQSSGENKIAALLQQSWSEAGSSQASSRDAKDKTETLPTTTGCDETLLQANVDPFWITKGTSCDVEIDVDVGCIMNVNAVMTSMPDDAAEKENIHWRAVPSLREIWQEERRRMAKLLPPEDDFLSQAAFKAAKDESAAEDGTTPPFTLSVKKNASVPGSQQAVKGMKRLLNITVGLEDDFVRAAQDIVDRHAAAVTRVDEILKSSPATWCTPQEAKERHVCSSELTPTVDDAIDALGALASQFGAENVDCRQPLGGLSADSSMGRSSSHRFDSGPGRTTLSTHDSNSDSENGSSQLLSQRQKFDHLSQSCYNWGKESINNATSIDPREFSQRVDRGDAIIVDGPFQNVEDYIDPHTLTPFDTLEDDDDDLYDDEDEELDEQGVEQMMSVLATQLCETKNASSSHDVACETAGNSCLETMLMLPSDDECMSVASRVDNEVMDGGVYSRLRVPADNQLPPSSGQLQGSAERLLPLDTSQRKVAPSWLPQTSADASVGKTFTNDFSPLVPPTGMLIQPTKPPPRRDAVAAWHRKRCKNINLGDSKMANKKHKKTAEQAEKGMDVLTNLNIDETTGKLMAIQANSEARGVEEVDWVFSQNQHIFPSQSQQSQQSQQQPTGECAPAVANIQDGKNGMTMAPPAAASTMFSESLSEMNLSSADSARNLNSETGSSTLSYALVGMANQGGRLIVEGGGCLKATTRPSQPNFPQSQRLPDQGSIGSVAERYLPKPLTVMSVEIHVQSRKGGTGSNEKVFALTHDPVRDKVSAVVYVYGVDPGGGETLQIKEHGCLFVPFDRSNGQTEANPSFDESKFIRSCLPRQQLGKSTRDVRLTIESVRDERNLLMRTASIIRRFDPDMLLSWDPQSQGIGYLVERGENLGGNDASGTGAIGERIDMVRLLGRTPMYKNDNTLCTSSLLVRDSTEAASAGVADPSTGGKAIPERARFEGSGLGSEWDERVGAGAAAASIVGRLVFAGWKVISEEVKHQQNSYLPAMVSTILGKRIPHHDELNLTNWYACNHGIDRWRVLHHKLAQASATLLLFDALDVIGRAGEAARLSGVEFSQSFPGIRGSQYKVEGVLLRSLQSLKSDERGSKQGYQNAKIPKSLATRMGGAFSASMSEGSKSQSQSPWKNRRKSTIRSAGDCTGQRHESSSSGYFFFSPSLQDTSKQEALEVQALNLEPQSGHHTDPVVVCDFTALYPSLMIAYNLCYSTTCGKLKYHTTRREMCLEGQTTGRVGPFLYPESRTATVLKHHLKSANNHTHQAFDLTDRAYIAPTGTIFVSESVVRGVLPQVLDELLSTRAMLKKASKQYKRLVPDLSRSILRQLEARQLALKYVANVTYGYTSATFSGRCAMPVLADTIVECGRCTLTNAINLANEWGRVREGPWYGCEVLYGDTDSVFIKLPGRSVEEAFQFGDEFCRTVTALNPPPVQLKLEKVYLGSILQTKKKYCGMKFESKEQKKPLYEAKGIETVRRDQCPLTQKILRNSLITLFRHGVSAVRDYLCRQWSLILSGQVPVSDFILTGRVRSKYRGGRLGPVQAALFRRLVESDPGRVMRSGERLAYVIVATPGIQFRLRECVLEPMELLTQWDSFTIHATYYIERLVNAALNRCFKLPPHRIDINRWYEACPKPRRRIHFWPVTRSGSIAMISSYFGSDMCSICGKKCKAQGRARAVVCDMCKRDELTTSVAVIRKLQNVQREAHSLAQQCSKCNLCFEDASTFAAVKERERKNDTVKMKQTGSSPGEGLTFPLAACTSIDCPITYERHRLREAGLEAEAICQALEL